ncbi:MAG TPA: MarR family transcriptional regulator [Candidatus Bathyarchaeia archaeon]|nr:MarR family transcriptional regulator [Candidatus Bathyarchaeia archaeon]
MSSNPAREDLFHALNDALREFSTDTIVFHQAIADKLGLNPTDHKCLDMILRNSPMTAGRLSELTGFTTGTVTGVLDRLEEAGYIYRDKDPNDRRKVIIHVRKDKAEREIYPLFQSLGTAINTHLHDYSEKEVLFLLDFLAKCRSMMEEARKQL